MPCPADLALQSLAGISLSACKALADALPVDAAPFKAIAAAVVPCCPALLFVAGLLPFSAVGTALPGNDAGPSSSLIGAGSVASAASESRGSPTAISYAGYLQTFLVAEIVACNVLHAI